MGIQTNQHINTVFNPLFPPPPMAKESCRHTTKTIYTIYTMIKPTIINYDKTMIKPCQLDVNNFQLRPA